MSSVPRTSVGDDGVTIVAFDPPAANTYCDDQEVRSYFCLRFLAETNDARLLVVDLSGIQTLDSSCLGPLVQRLNDVKKRQGRMALCGVHSPALIEIFRLIRFDRIFSMHSSVAEARKYVLQG